MGEVGIGLGSNLGDRASLLGAALAALESTPGVAVSRIASVYETAPWGMTDQPAFLNSAALLLTTLAPIELLRAAKTIETRLGRTARERWGPREIDIDLLFFDDVALKSPELTLPHPHLFERPFVLVPLNEAAPGRTIGGRGLAASVASLSEAARASVVRNAAATEALRAARDRRR